jgi:hypothetical protein
MTGEPGAKEAPHPSTDGRAQGQDVLGLWERQRDYLLAWVGENLTLVRRTASGERFLYWILGIGSVVGLAATGILHRRTGRVWMIFRRDL